MLFIDICISKVKISNCVCQMVSELPEPVVETVLLTQEESLNKNSGQKKKNRERGKVKPQWLLYYEWVCHWQECMSLDCHW